MYKGPVAGKVSALVSRKVRVLRCTARSWSGGQGQITQGLVGYSRNLSFIWRAWGIHRRVLSREVK